MRRAFSAVSDAAALLAVQVPRSAIETLAMAIAASEDQTTFVHAIPACIPHAYHRALASRFVEVWQENAAEVPPVAAAMCLLGAVEGIGQHRSDESVELVWTGPDVGVIPVRLTEQALIQLVDASHERVTVVNFAVYHVPRVCEALRRAAARGCSISLILETPDGQEGPAGYDTVAALGSGIRECSEIYVWPATARQADSKGRRGLMHVKAAIADGERLLLSSANLTEYALSTNMELGVLITGGRLPRDAQRHFDELVRSGVLISAAAR